MGRPYSGFGEQVHAMLHPHAARRSRLDQEVAARNAASEADWVERSKSALNPWRFKLALVPHSEADIERIQETTTLIRRELAGPHTIVMAGIYQANRREIVEPGVSRHRAELGRELSARALGLLHIAKATVLHEEPAAVSTDTLIHLAPELTGMADPQVNGELFGIVLAERRDFPMLSIASNITGPYLFGGPTYIPGKLSWITLK